MYSATCLPLIWPAPLLLVKKVNALLMGLLSRNKRFRLRPQVTERGYYSDLPRGWMIKNLMANLILMLMANLMLNSILRLTEN